MNLVDNSVCAQCGARLAVPDGRTPSVRFVGTGGRPNRRVVTIDGKEIHRCDAPRGRDNRANRLLR